MPARGVGVPLGAVCLLFALGGCGEVKHNNDANLIVGKQQFVAKCGSCHALARASTKGTVGPDLDEAFRASLEEGLERSAVQTVVEGQVQNPNRLGVMPGGLAQGTTLTDIAAYVAEAADRPGQDTGLLASAVQAPGAGKPAVEKAGKLELEADPQGQLSYTASKASASAGTVTVSMKNMSGVSHNLAIEAGAGGASGSSPVLGATPLQTKGSASITVKLKPGTYTFFCQATGHRAAGMYGTLTVK
ncbi:MAG TPA: plastocyanin/azurin family copper-binding protein [Solirubrobacteraceae bacterium]|nr:plastocyanin/azurin family copper-binding protein [Solirubrobacteraceae bacterium]